MVIGYHRFLSHKSFKLSKWFQYMIITAGLPAGTPIQWAGNHRAHHLHSDRDLDPHSPVVRGFWHAHNGWYYNINKPFLCFLFALAGPIRFVIDAYGRPRTNQEYNHLAEDISNDKYYAFISKPLPYMLIVGLHLLIPFGFAFSMWSWTGFFALWLTLVIIFNLGDGIDSIAHLLGEQPYKMGDEARNNWWFALFTFGDGWHADHHAFPGSAKLGFEKGRIDISWHIIKILAFFGIASKIQRISPEKVRRKLKSTNQ